MSTLNNVKWSGLKVEKKDAHGTYRCKFKLRFLPDIAQAIINREGLNDLGNLGEEVWTVEDIGNVEITLWWDFGKSQWDKSHESLFVGDTLTNGKL